ncbi:MAG: hypothetical protein ABI183_19640 [Polyangiaceae bacterium]
MPPSTIVATESIDGFFQEIVTGAIRSRRVEATGEATTYLVALLADFAMPEKNAARAMDRPLTFLLDEALHTTQPAERFERLRLLGDGVLYSTGFFGDHFEARGVDQKYLIGIGAAAYGAASSMLVGHASGQTSANSEPFPDVFGELAEKFGVFVDVVGEVANLTIAKGAATSQSLLHIYERWLKTGSESLATALNERGLVPVRGTRGTLQ